MRLQTLIFEQLLGTVVVILVLIGVYNTIWVSGKYAEIEQ